jgi:hypothetical protein
MIPHAILAVSALITVPSQEVDPARFLAAVREVAGTAGTSSPLGPYDLTRVVWMQYAPHLPYSDAKDETYALLVAKEHFRWLATNLRKAKMPVEVYALAACWRLGLEGGKRALRHGEQIQYADSVHNIYYCHDK